MSNAFSNLWSSQTIAPDSWLTIIFSLVLAFAVGLFIAWTYRRNYRGVMYSNNFTLTLVLMTLITCPVVMCIRESIQLSMGMVGALSIVRFRTAVKDPLDTALLLPFQRELYLARQFDIGLQFYRLRYALQYYNYKLKPLDLT